MKLGAQLYTLRDHIQTAEDMKETFLKVKAMGYEVVQLSAYGDIPGEKIHEICEETGTTVTCTHARPAEAFFNGSIDEVIRAHKAFGCPVIGMGSMPKEYREDWHGVEDYLAKLAEPVKKIEAAGLSFAYHNHAFEFEIKFPDGRSAYDVMIERCPTWNFIMDTYWVAKAGYDPCEYLRKIGGKRLANIHYKDMAKDEEKSICACGDGILDFRKITDVCLELGVKNALVEQDNAKHFPDGAFSQMERSARYLRPIIPLEK